MIHAYTVGRTLPSLKLSPHLCSYSDWHFWCSLDVVSRSLHTPIIGKYFEASLALDEEDLAIFEDSEPLSA